MKSKKVFALILVVIMLSLFAFGCQQPTQQEVQETSTSAPGDAGSSPATEGTTAAAGETSAETEGTTTASGGDSTTASIATENAADEPVTLVYQCQNLNTAHAISGFLTDPVTKAIEEKLNIRLDLRPMNSFADYPATFATQLASRDFPDIVYALVNTDAFQQVMTANVALELTDLVEQYGRNIQANAPIMLQLSRELYSKDLDGNSIDGLYFIRTPNGNLVAPTEPQYGIFMRYDVWKEVGSPTYETVFDLIPILKTMQDAHPQSEDGLSCYGVGAWFGDSWGIWQIQVPFQYFKGHWQWSNCSYVDLNENKQKSLLTEDDSSFWMGMEWWNKAYRAGILDPEAFIMKHGEYMEKASTNRQLMTFSMGNGAGNNTFIANGDLLKGQSLFPLPGDVPAYYFNPALPDGHYSNFISVDCKRPDKAMQFLDYLFSYEGVRMVYNGIEGDTWEMKDGKPTYTQKVLEKLAAPKTPEEALEKAQGEAFDMGYEWGLGLFTSICGFWGPADDPEYNQPFDLRFQPETVEISQTMLQKACAGDFGVSFVGESYFERTYDQLLAGLLSAAWQPMTGEISDIDTAVLGYINDNYANIIQANDDEEYNRLKLEMQEGARKLNEERVVEFYGSLSDSAVEKWKSMTN